MTILGVRNQPGALVGTGGDAAPGGSSWEEEQHRKVLRFTLSHSSLFGLTVGLRVLEIGKGSNGLAAHFKAVLTDCYYTVIDPGAFGQAAWEQQIQAGDSVEDTGRGGADVVIFNRVCSHMKGEVFEALLKDVAARLRPNGVIVVVDQIERNGTIRSKSELEARFQDCLPGLRALETRLDNVPIRKKEDGGTSSAQQMIAVFRGNETLYPVLLSTDYTFELQQPFGDALLSRTPFGVAKGKWNLLVGRSGSGKTTFLRALQGDLPSYTRGAGELPQRRFYMPQNVDVFEPFSTVDNVRAYGGKPQDAFASFEELALARKFWGRKNAIEISGGERQRLIVAQIIAARPDMLLLDEPSKGLDRAGRLVTFNALARHFSGRAEYNAVTVVCADHDFGGIYNMFDYVFEILDGRQTLVWSKSPSR